MGLSHGGVGDCPEKPKRLEAVIRAAKKLRALSLPSLVLRPLDLLLFIIAVLLSFIMRKLDKGVAALHVIQNEMSLLPHS